MWILQLTLRHDCIIGNRCKKFNCTSTGYPLDFYQDSGAMYYMNYEHIEGKQEDVDCFLKDLKKDKSIVQFEAHGNAVFFLAKGRKGSMPSQESLKAKKKVFHTKPVVVDNQGLEHWEVASWNRADINEFIRYIKDKTHGLEECSIKSVKKAPVDELFFPQLMPKITASQKKALDIAIAEGYYEFPRKIELQQLAHIMGVSLSTYREHLRKAERIMLPHMRHHMFFDSE